MTTWEYATLVNYLEGAVLLNTTGAAGSTSTEVANNAGAAGWEAVGFAFTPTGQVVSLFKRPTGTI